MRILVALGLAAAAAVAAGEVVPGEYVVLVDPDAPAARVQEYLAAVQRFAPDPPVRMERPRGGPFRAVLLRGVDAPALDVLRDVLFDRAVVSHWEPNQRASLDLGGPWVFNATINDTVTQTDADWALDRIDQRALPLNGKYIYQEDAGEGITVFVLDSGIYIEHDDFEGRAEHGVNLVDEPMEDLQGHGTHVASLAAGKRYGVAKKARVVSVKVIKEDGYATVGDIIRGIEWTVQTGEPSRSVINLSLGAFGQSTALEATVETARDRGFVIVAAAGNDGRDACSFSPARSPYSVTVFASTRSDNIASFSNHGACCTIAAPGQAVLGADIRGPSSSVRRDGTSMSAPLVAGTVALFLARLAYDGHLPRPADVERYLLGMATTDNLETSAGSPNKLVFTLDNGDYSDDGNEFPWMVVTFAACVVVSVGGVAYLFFRRRRTGYDELE